VKHLDENVAASRVRLSPDDVIALESLAPSEPGRRTVTAELQK
jgi:hypothetical protein